jgi:predicted RNA-binding Zn-ribbon protein involved in translation (DUF1610 family)
MPDDQSETQSVQKLTCVNCLYDVTGMAEHATCPECGNQIIFAEASIPQSTRKATIGMVFGILSTVTCIGYGAFFGLPSAIAGIWISGLALYDISNDKAPWHSRTMAWAGLICGLLGLVLNLLMLVYVVNMMLYGNFI